MITKSFPLPELPQPGKHKHDNPLRPSEAGARTAERM